MKLDGLFIEYLITGGVAFLWIYPLTLLLGLDPSLYAMDTKAILIAIPITYIIGMIIDYYASIILRKPKKNFRDNAYKKEGLEALKSTYKAMYKIAIKSEELLKHFEMRDSRVRATRGAFINFSLSTILIPAYFISNQNLYLGITLFVLMLWLAITAWYMWKKMIKLFYRFQVQTLKPINEEKKG